MQNITVVAQTYPQTPRFKNFCRWPTKCPRRPRQGLRLPPICVLWVRFEGTPVRFYYCGPRLVLATRFWTANGGPVFPAHARTARGGAPGTNWPANSYSASSTLAPQRRGISLFPYICLSLRRSRRHQNGYGYNFSGHTCYKFWVWSNRSLWQEESDPGVTVKGAATELCNHAGPGILLRRLVRRPSVTQRACRQRTLQRRHRAQRDDSHQDQRDDDRHCALPHDLRAHTQAEERAQRKQ